MTIRFRHKGCTSVIVVYHGEVDLQTGPVLRSAEWAWPDGSRIMPGSMRVGTCPDCKATVAIHPGAIEPIPRKPP